MDIELYHKLESELNRLRLRVEYGNSQSIEWSRLTDRRVAELQVTLQWVKWLSVINLTLLVLSPFVLVVILASMVLVEASFGAN